jgi:hypothetical protein
MLIFLSELLTASFGPRRGVTFDLPRLHGVSRGLCACHLGLRIGWFYVIFGALLSARLLKSVVTCSMKKIVLGRTNRLLFLIRHGSHWKRRFHQFYCCVCIRFSGNVSTEPLPSNDRGIFTEPLPSNDKGILPSRDLISLLYFFKISRSENTIYRLKNIF